MGKSSSSESLLRDWVTGTGAGAGASVSGRDRFFALVPVLNETGFPRGVAPERGGTALTLACDERPGEAAEVGASALGGFCTVGANDTCLTGAAGSVGGRTGANGLATGAGPLTFGGRAGFVTMFNVKLGMGTVLTPASLFIYVQLQTYVQTAAGTCGNEQQSGEGRTPKDPKELGSKMDSEPRRSVRPRAVSARVADTSPEPAGTWSFVCSLCRRLYLLPFARNFWFASEVPATKAKISQETPASRVCHVCNLNYVVVVLSQQAFGAGAPTTCRHRAVETHGKAE